MAQKPFYAANGGTGTRLASRFQTADTASNTIQNNDIGIANRVDISDNSIPTTTTTTERLPIDALGDRELINRISKWPRDKQPFWFINSQQIEEHRQNPQPVQPAIQSRSSFARGA